MPTSHSGSTYSCPFIFESLAILHILTIQSQFAVSGYFPLKPSVVILVIGFCLLQTTASLANPINSLIIQLSCILYTTALTIYTLSSCYTQLCSSISLYKTFQLHLYIMVKQDMPTVAYKCLQFYTSFRITKKYEG